MAKKPGRVGLAKEEKKCNCKLFGDLSFFWYWFTAVWLTVRALWSVPTVSSKRVSSWSAGLGVRFWAKGLVARIDSAVSDKGFEVRMMVAQPFQF